MNVKMNFRILIASCILISSCRVVQPETLPPVRKMPAQFEADKTDTATISNISWKKYFGDPYLVQLIDTALNSNPDLMIALQRIQIAQAQLSMRRAAFLPSVSGVAAAAFDRFGDYTMNGVGNFDTNLSPNIKEDQKIPVDVTPDYFVGLKSNWEIDLWGKLKSRKKAAVANLLATEQGRHLAVTQIVAEVAMLYYELLSLDNELAIVNRNIDLQQQAVDVVKVQKLAGKATQLAVQQFSAQLMNTKTIAHDIQRNINETQNQLNVLLGRYPDAIQRDTSFLHQSLPLYSETGLPSQLLIRRPDIRQAEFQLQAAKANVDAARAEFLPSLNLSPYVGFNAFRSALLFNPASIAYGVATGLTAPVFNQRQIRGNFEISNAEAREALYNYQQKLLSGYTEIVTQINNIENASKMYDLKQQEVNELKAAVSTARELYLTGYANYLEIITAQRGVLEAELQLTEIKKQLFHHTIQLYRALGGGWQN